MAKKASARIRKPGSSNPLPSSVPTKKSLSKTIDFYLDDFNRTLFPLKTNKLLIQHGENEIRDYIGKCLNGSEKAHSFLPQRRVYAAKPDLHLRRTVKLDVVSEYYIYDVIFRNRGLFKKPHSANREHYGYRLEDGVAISPTSAYKAFKGALADYSQKYSRFMSFDVASYFNSVYHHDLVSWFLELGAPQEDAEGLGQLLRQINSGRSVDCLPQGLYPTKMIGNDFLRFIDNFHALKSNQLVRFMDDFYLFSDDQSCILDDFQIVQQLLGDKGLSVNPKKTTRGQVEHIRLDRDIDAAKQKLLKRRRFFITEGYDDDGDETTRVVMLKSPLTDSELRYLSAILDQPQIEEEDAELILTIMRDHADRVESRLPYIIRTYPHLAKNVHAFCAGIDDYDSLAAMLLAILKAPDRLQEFQLFWFGAILEDYLLNTPSTAALISVLFNHPSATSITKAKILEIPDRRFGLPELRNEFLSSGQSDWLAWSSAVGTKSLQRGSRNHKLKYFGNSSAMNHLIAKVALEL